ncbi:LysM peptidoglycan-binding domain-containing protein [uncultured Acetobacteroides sp.]|uniref:amino acid ABC transporter substrate-binding protein n=1 Tax=uncultured Acetobacteroides sp. TaxID=1760811 RepID=UPI0029F51105|nr:LysM peptidoglycan-binding domain-containing protein [uncultured Acetobacteroides sp.]
MRYFFTFLLINAFLINAPVAGQTDSAQVKVVKDKVKISGKLYYIHTVRTGETLYNIARAYQIAQEAILESNPELSQGVKVGNTIKIPVVQDLKNPNKNKGTFHIVKKGETLYSIAKEYSIPTERLAEINQLMDFNVKENQSLFISTDRDAIKQHKKELIASLNETQVAAASPVKLVSHEVLPKETLTSISKKYGITIDELVGNNPFLKAEGLKVGQVLAIPTKQDKGVAAAQSVPEKSAVSKEPYAYKSTTVFNVVMMLPFGGAHVGLDSLGKGAASRRFDDMMQYYEGTLVAIDSLKNKGVSVNLTVIDTKSDKDPSAVAQALKNPALKEANLIIGPVYPEAIPTIAKYAQSHRIPMVSPLANTEPLVKNNDYLIQIASEADVLAKLSVEYAKKGEGKTILVVPSDGSDAKLVKEFKAMLKEKLPELSYRQGNNAASQREALRGKLAEGKKTRFVVLSNNEVFVLDFLQNLTTASKGYDVEVLGTQKWLKFNSIDIAYLHGSNVQMYVQNYVDYNQESAKSFVRSFRNYYKADPNNYAFRGFDVAYFFIDAMRKLGPDFVDSLPKLSSKNVHTPFRFVKEGDGGYMNTDAALIKHVEGYKVVRLK